MKIKTTIVFEKNWDAKTRFIVNQGSSRSSKTYSICQKYILKLAQEDNKVLTIARKSTPSLRASVLRDFLGILVDLDLYEPQNHDKTNNLYRLGTNLIEFVGLDNPQKKRGAKRNYLWLNEANEFNLEDFRQMNIRTSEEVTLDYNPSDEYHWIYDEVLPRPDCTFIHSTYKDNVFLEQSLIDEIERLKEIDENYWRIFGLGERGTSQATVFTNNWEIVQEVPEVDEFAFGVDWGYNHPLACVWVGIKDNVLYWDERYYEKGKVTSQFIEAIPAIGGQERDYYVCDSAEKDRIMEMYQADYTMTSGARKGNNSVIQQLNVLKGVKIKITARSVNLLKEIKNYKFKVDRDGVVLDDPVKINDDAIDSARYASIFLLNMGATMAKYY